MPDMKPIIFCFLFAFTLSGCNWLNQQQGQQADSNRGGQLTEPRSPPAQQRASDENARFVFPAKSGPFAEASVALDTVTGRLCKTYAWEDNAGLPRGLTLCSELAGAKTSRAGATSDQAEGESCVGATKAYSGFAYTFNGSKWVKGTKALKYNPKTQALEPGGDDQYDPLNLHSKEEKAARVLSAVEIQRVADQFGVSYEEAVNEAKQHGYQVAAKH